MIEQCDQYAVADIKKAEEVRLASYGTGFVFELSWADEQTWIYTENGPLVARKTTDIHKVLREIKEINPKIDITYCISDADL